MVAHVSSTARLTIKHTTSHVGSRHVLAACCNKRTKLANDGPVDQLSKNITMRRHVALKCFARMVAANRCISPTFVAVHATFGRYAMSWVIIG